MIRRHIPLYLLLSLSTLIYGCEQGGGYGSAPEYKRPYDSDQQNQNNEPQDKYRNPAWDAFNAQMGVRPEGMSDLMWRSLQEQTKQDRERNRMHHERMNSGMELPSTNRTSLSQKEKQMYDRFNGDKDFRDRIVIQASVTGRTIGQVLASRAESAHKDEIIAQHMITQLTSHDNTKFCTTSCWCVLTSH